MDDPDESDDVGWWDCSLCTYKNSADKFKCDICDLRRGTSTRKPRCNADTIVAQVVRQQEQIRQQTQAKPSSASKVARAPANSSTRHQGPSASTSESQSKSKKSHRTPEPKTRPSGERVGDASSEDENEEEARIHSDHEGRGKKLSSSHGTKKKQKVDRSGRKVTKSSIELYGDSSADSESSNDTVDKVANSPRTRIIRERSSSSSSGGSNYSSSGQSSPDRAISSPNSHDDHALENKKKTQSFMGEDLKKIIPIEINGNLIKYAPPTSTGRTGLIIDKKKFTQHSVTINDVTITFTEFATRQNNYVRKKKRRREHTRSRPNHSHKNSNQDRRDNGPEGARSETSNPSRLPVKTEPKLSPTNNNTIYNNDNQAKPTATLANGS